MLSAVYFCLLWAVVAKPIFYRALQQSETQQPLHFFVFGDSYTASGFNISGEQPSPAQPFGNPAIGTSPDDLLGNLDIANKTSANGPIWPQYLTATYNTTVTLTYDFAISGASIPDGYSSQILEEYEPKYAALNNVSDGWTANNSIFASWIGINDINWCSFLFAKNATTSYYESCLPPRMDMYFDLMDGVYNTGARNFIFLNMPPLQRAPMVFQNGDAAVSNYANAVSFYNNDLLPKYVQNFTSTHRGVNTVVYDAHTLFSEILDHPQWYGFRDSTCYTCIGCTNGTGCFWTNNYHPQTNVHNLLAKDMLSNLTTVGWPMADVTEV